MNFRDHVDGVGGMDWRLAGLVSVAHGEGPEVSRSAAGPAGAEALWVPTALLPRFGVRWSASDPDQVRARKQLGGDPLAVRYQLDRHGRVVWLVVDRWGDPDGSGAWAWHPFSGQVAGYRTFDGVTVPSAGRVGWFFGTERWPAGEFLRYQLTDLRLHTAADR